MITITQLSGEVFLTINYDKNNTIEYNEMKILFDTNIVITSYYMLVNNDKNIYTNLYDIYEMKFENEILLDDLNIIFLPYDKKDINNIKNNISFYYNFLNFTNENLKNDKLFVLMSVNISGALFEFISNELKYDKEIIFNAAMNNFNCLEHIPYEYKNDKEFFKKYISYNGCNIQFASDNLKNDYEIIKLAIDNDNGYVLEFLNDLYKDNEEFIIPILNKYPNCFEYISKRLQNKKNIILLCINRIKELKNTSGYTYYNPILYFINDINKNDKEIVLPLVSMSGYDIQYIPNNLPITKDKDIVYAAIKNAPTAYIFIDQSFFNNKEFVLMCLGSNDNYDEDNYSNFLEYINYKFRDDKEIVIACLKKCCKNIIYCSERLKNDKDVILTAINNCYYDSYDELDKNIYIILNNTNIKNDFDILTLIEKKLYEFRLLFL